MLMKIDQQRLTPLHCRKCIRLMLAHVRIIGLAEARHAGRIEQGDAVDGRKRI